MKKRLLLVEDEEHLAFTLKFNLDQEGYQVDRAATVAEAYRFLEESSSSAQEKAKNQQSTYDLLLLDVMLPDGDGFSLCESIRKQGDKTPVLFLTAKGTPDDIVAGLEAGADGYITKPFNLKELLARIVAMLRRQSWKLPETEQVSEQEVQEEAQEDIQEYRFVDHCVNFETHEVIAKGKPVELTALEFKLLHFFIQNENKVVTRKDLLERVWEVSTNNYTRAVDNFLVRLRRVFEKDPSKPVHFLTVRGVGYRFLGACKFPEQK